MDSWRDYLPIPVVLTILGAIWRFLRPRRLLSFIAAVLEREDMLAAATYWEQEAGRWERRAQFCQEDRDRQDQEISRLRQLLRDGGMN